MSQTFYEFCLNGHAELLQQWHDERNAPLTPKDLSYGTTRKVWWRCPNGHEWQAFVSNRRKGNGCPICANKRVTAGINDFAALHQELLKEWHPVKNNGVSPYGMASTSREHVWWICEKGHEWQAPVASRSKGNHCPICSNRRVEAGVNDLETVRPDLAEQWHPEKNGGIRPADLFWQSTIGVWWLCDKGHAWKASAASRCRGSRCPVCSNRKIIPGVNDFRTAAPWLAAQWHPTKNEPLQPQQVSLHSGKKVWWKCEKGHEWQATIASRTAGAGCPLCVNRKILPGVNDFALLAPDLAAQWHPTKNEPLRPQQVSLHSGKKVWWRCERGHEWQAVVATRAAGCGCPYCAGKRAIPGETDLAATHPLLAAQWHPVKNAPLRACDVTAGSSRKVWWQCSRQHEWRAAVSSRVHGRRCPYCSSHLAIAGETDLATTAPDLAAQWHPSKNDGLTARDIKAKSGKQVWWLCQQGHAWQASPLRRSRGDGCPYCSGRRIIAGFNSLQARMPDLAAQWHPEKNRALTPEQVFVWSKTRVWWICGEGHEWQTTVSARASGSGCPVCSKRKVQAGFNDLASLNPLLAAQWHPSKNGALTPADVTVSSSRKVWWLCNRGHELYASVNSRRGVICPRCNSELHTSFAEQAIYHYVSQRFHVYNRYQFHGREIDVYIPSLSLGIEHDGAFHQAKAVQVRDRKKEALLREHGVSLIRIKTGSACFVDSENQIICYDDKRRDHLSTLEWAIRCLFTFLEQRTGMPIPVDVHIERDRIAIYQQYILLEKQQSLSERFPEAAAFWHPAKNGMLQPAWFSAMSGKKVWWQCALGHEWEKPICAFAKRPCCPYCDGRKVLPGFNDLQTRRPLLAEEWHPTKNAPLKASDVSEFSNRKVWWKCREGHAWQNSINNRSNGKNCPICAGQQVLRGYNDLGTHRPDLAGEWHPSRNGSLEPWGVTVRSGRTVWWLCPKGHEWQARIADRSAGNRCPYCSGRLAIRGETDLATLHPTLAAQWHPVRNGELMPDHVKPYSHNSVWWLCEKSHEWKDTVAHHTKLGGCPYCEKAVNR